MSGYLQRSKGNKKHWKRLWFVIKNKVLYTYAASEVWVTDWVIYAEYLPCSLAQFLFCPSGCCSFGESTSAGLFLERGEERARSETSVQVVSQKYAVLHFQGWWHPNSTKVSEYYIADLKKKKKKSTQPRALYLFPCVFHVTKSWLFHLSVGNKFTIALRVFSPLFKSSDWKCKTLKRILNVMYFTHLCWCFLSLGGLKPSKRRWFLNSNLVSQHHRASSWTTYDPWLDLRSVVTSSGRTPVARLF